MKLREAYDVIVIGGGPGGAAAAITAARRGLSVLLIEKRQEIGTPVRCAEAIGRDQVAPFIALNPAWIAAEIDAFRIFGPSGQSVRVPPTSPTIVVERKLFDRELVNAAVQAGATARAMTRATGLIIEDGFVRGVKMISLSREETVRARVVIGADGPESQVGLWAGLSTMPRMADYYTGFEYLLAGIPLDDPRECQYHIGNDLAPGGYAWVFPKGPDKANVGLVITATHEKNGRSAQDYLDAFVERRFPGASVLAVMLGGIPVGGTVKELVGNGVMLVGDAAHQAEPITGGGINLAMFAGEMAANVAADAIAAGDWSKKALEAYPRRWHQEHGRAIKSMAALRHSVLKFSDERYDRLVALAAELPLAEMSAFDIILRVLRHDPALLLAAREFLIPT
ncbi:MAG: NAD(P)/FAD-dependent oxidoreductase [Anaerolineae bacterium]|nr:NAD(P)/FAD-dependent oxidoreductase [Anaerolineae bacterium]